MKLSRIGGTTAVLIGITALSLVGASSAQAATVSPAQIDHTYSIKMQLTNTSSEPLTLDSAVDDDGAHWQQRAPQTLPADMTNPVDVTAYSEDPSGFLTTVTYTTPSGDAIVFQAVNYFDEQDTEGLTVSHDPSMVVEFLLHPGRPHGRHLRGHAGLIRGRRPRLGRRDATSAGQRGRSTALGGS